MNGLVDISFEELVESCEVLREQYEVLLAPFFNAPAIRCWKKMIYSLKMSEKKKNLIWEVLNGDLEYEELLETIKK